MKLRLARRYAQAMFRVAQERQILYEVQEELSLVEQVFAEPEVYSFFSNPGIPAAAKKETIVRLVGGNVSGLVQNFLCHLIDKRRTAVLPDIIKAYRKLVKQAYNILEVQVITASELAEQDQKNLVAQLANITGKTIEMYPQVDRRILGGLIIQIGDKRIDNSVVAKLANLRNFLLNKECWEGEVTNSL